MLKFPDDTQVGIIVLEEIMAELCGEGRKATDEAIEEIIKRLEAKIAFMKEAMPHMMEIFGKDPQKMMCEMMPFCMSMMKTKGIGMERMRTMMKGMME